MIYAQIINGAFASRIDGSVPYKFSETVNQPADTLDQPTQQSFGLYPLTLVPQPTFDPTTSECVDSTTQMIGGMWTQVWSVVPLSTAQLCSNADAKLAAALSGGFVYNGVLHHCDGVFQTQVQAFLLAFQSGIIPATGTVTIRAMDNSMTQMTQAQITQFAGTLLGYVQGLYQANWAVHDAA